MKLIGPSFVLLLFTSIYTKVKDNHHVNEFRWLSFQEELDSLKNKFERLEQEKAALKLETSKLEAKVSFIEFKINIHI